MDQEVGHRFDDDISLVVRPRKQSPPVMKDIPIYICKSRVLKIKRAIALLKTRSGHKPRFCTHTPYMNIRPVIDPDAEPAQVSDVPLSPHRLSRKYIADEYAFLADSSNKLEIFLRKQAISFSIGKQVKK